MRLPLQHHHHQQQPLLLAAALQPCGLARVWPSDSQVAAWRRRHNQRTCSIGALVAAEAARECSAAAAAAPAPPLHNAGLDSDGGSSSDDDGSDEEMQPVPTAAAAAAPSTAAAGGGGDGAGGSASLSDFDSEFIALPATGLQPPRFDSSSSGGDTGGGGGGGASQAKRARVAPVLVDAGLPEAAMRSSTAASAPVAPRRRMNAPAPPAAAMGTVPWPFMLIPITGRGGEKEVTSPEAAAAAATAVGAARALSPASSPAAAAGAAAAGAAVTHWDLVCPSACAPVVWRALVTHGGAAAVGLLEWQGLQAARGTPVFPCDFPDTPAGAGDAARAADEAFEAYMMRPRAKRTNFGALRCPAPFEPAWGLLWDDAQPRPPGGEQPPTLEPGGGEQQQPLQRQQQPGREEEWPVAARCPAVVRGRSYVAGFMRPLVARHGDSSSSSSSSLPPQLPRLTAAPTLLRVRLCMWDHGVLQPGAMLCAPTAEDLAGWAASVDAAQRQWQRQREGGSADAGGSRLSAALAALPVAAVAAAAWEPPLEPAGAGLAWPAKTKSVLLQAGTAAAATTTADAPEATPASAAAVAAASGAPGDLLLRCSSSSAAAPAALVPPPAPPPRPTEDGRMCRAQFQARVLQPCVLASPPTRRVVGFVTSAVYDHARRRMQPPPRRPPRNQVGVDGRGGDDAHSRSAAAAPAGAGRVTAAARAGGGGAAGGGSTNACVGIGFLRCEAAGWLLALASDAAALPPPLQAPPPPSSPVPAGVAAAAGTLVAAAAAAAPPAPQLASERQQQQQRQLLRQLQSAACSRADAVHLSSVPAGCATAAGCAGGGGGGGGGPPRVGRPLLLLVRNPGSAQYRAAVADVVAE